MMDNQAIETPIQDPSVYDMQTLVDWYIKLRNHKSELKRSIEPALAHTDKQMEAIEKEFHKRIVDNGVSSMRTSFGVVSRQLKTKYLLTDSFAFRQWVQRNPEVGSMLFQGISQGEIKNFIEEHGQAPEGVTVDQFFDISVRRA